MYNDTMRGQLHDDGMQEMRPFRKLSLIVTLFQCMCPAQGRSYPSCPTGYVFDYMEECRCVAVSVLGELELEIALAVTFLSLLATILSLVQCYRRGIGLFRCSY